MKYLISLLALAFAAGAYAKDAASATDAPAAKTTQQQKMKTCNAEAKAGEKKGAERKAFMKECLSGSKK